MLCYAVFCGVMRSGLVEWTDEVREAVRLQRDEVLGISQSEAATRSGISLAVWNELESGRRKVSRPRTASLMARALGWTPDSIERLARGEEPVEAVPERPAVYGSTPDGRGLSDRELELIDAAVKAALERIRGEQ